MKTGHSADWVPLAFHSGLLDWCYAGVKRFTEPFFAETIDHVLTNPFAATFRQSTSLAELKAIESATPGLTPDCLIFHMSRSGSTSLAQILAASPRNIVIAEPPPLDSIVRSGLDEDLRAAWLRLVASALGRPRHGETRFFLKLNAWHILDFPLFRRVFPQTPAIFLYRDPLAVLISHARRPSQWALPGYLDSARRGFESAVGQEGGNHAMTLDEYRARLLASLLAAALESDAVPVSHTDLPAVALQLLPKLIDRDFEPSEIEIMRDAPQFNAVFQSNAQHKHQQATCEQRELVNHFLDAPYQQLESRHAERMTVA